MPGLTLNFMGHDVSASAVLRRLNGQAEDTAGRVSGHFSRMAGTIAGAFAGGAVVGFLKDSIAEATESQKVQRQTTAVIKSTGGAAHATASEIGNLATAISNKTGIDDEAVQSGENLLLTFTNVRNEAGRGNDVFNQTTRAAVDLSKATGTSLNGAFMQLGKAINDPVTGMTKLQRVGVSFTAQQRATNKALVEGGDVNALNALGYNVTSKSLEQLAKRYGGDLSKAVGQYTSEMTASQRATYAHLVEGGHVAEAQKNILREVNKEFGGSAAAQVTPAEKAAVAWGNLKEQIGTYLLPVIAKFANFLTQQVIPALVSTVGWLSRNAGTLKTVALYLAPIVAAWAAYSTITRVVAASQAALNLVMEANPIVLIVTAIIALVAAMVIAYKRSETFRKIVQTAFKVISDAAKFMWEKVLKPVFKMWRTEFQIVSTVVRSVASVLVAAWKSISSAVQAAWRVITQIYGWIKSGVRAVRDVVSSVGSAISGAFGKVGNGLSSAWRNTVSPIFSWLKSGVRAVRDVVSSVGSVISGAFGKVGNGLSSAWRNTISPIYNGIKSGIRSARDTVRNMVGSIVDAFSSLPGKIGGLAKQMLSAGASLMRNLFNGIRNALSSVGSFAANLGRSIVNGIIGAINSALGLPLKLPKFHIWGVGDVGGQTLLPRIPKFAQGTGFAPGGLAIVGEYGPEVVDVPRGSKVHTASTAASMAGGASVSITLSMPGQFYGSKEEFGRAAAAAIEHVVNDRGYQFAIARGVR